MLKYRHTPYSGLKNPNDVPSNFHKTHYKILKCRHTPYSGLKKPDFSHQAYQAASTYFGLYDSGIGQDVSKTVDKNIHVYVRVYEIETRNVALGQKSKLIQ